MGQGVGVGVGIPGMGSLPSPPPPPAPGHLPPEEAHPDSLTQSFAVFLIHFERKKGVQASGVLFGYWLLCFLFPAISAAQQASQGVSGGLGHLGTNMAVSALGGLLPPLFPPTAYALRKDPCTTVTQSDTPVHSLMEKDPSSHTFFYQYKCPLSEFPLWHTMG